VVAEIKGVKLLSMLMSAATDQNKTRVYVEQWMREGAIIAMITLAVYLGLALLTYHTGDPGWSSTGVNAKIHNLTGRVGAWIADILMYFFGYVAYLLPVMLTLKSLAMLKHRKSTGIIQWPMLAIRSAGFLVLLVACCTLLGMYSVVGLGPHSGGVIGKEIAQAGQSVFSLVGSTLIAVALMLTSISLATGLSWLKLMDWVGEQAIVVADKVQVFCLNASTGVRSRYADWRRQRAVDRPGEGNDTAPTPVKKVRKQTPKAITEQLPLVSERKEPVFTMSGASDIANDNAEGEIRTSLAGARPVEKSGSLLGLLRQLKGREGPAAELDAAPVEKPAGAASEGQGASEASSARTLKIEPFKKDPESAAKKIKGSLMTFFDQGTGALPSVKLLDPPDPKRNQGFSREVLEQMSRLLETRLAEFNVEATVVEVNPGPVITRFEIQPAPGVKVSKISGLAKDLARSLAVKSVRVVEVIPGKSVVGIEIPNENREMVRFSQVISSPQYEASNSPLTLALGYDIAGNSLVANLGKMPHLLVAGTTGSGKSVGVNAMILSMLYKATPEDLRLIMIDPKMLELSVYEGIPHLLTPVVTDMKDADNALRWCVGEMERRYRLMATMGVRNITGYNIKIREAVKAGAPILDPLWKPQDHVLDGEPQPELGTLPFIVVIVDEFADMMMIVGKKVEEKIARIAQKARAAGIHLILATQRPSVDVITGLIKANIPTRIAFQVSSKIDSRTILDQGGAEQLLGHGDMLYLPPGTGLPVRVHGAFVDDDEVHRVVEDWKQRGAPDYLEEILDGGDNDYLPGIDPASAQDQSGEKDALFDEAVAFVTESRKASISAVQRKLRIGYNRAATLVEAMEMAGVVSSAGHNGTREVLAPPAPRD
jgi:S-DNA-T family DNA segregation ATPase FtsK/SpoIIIE